MKQTYKKGVENLVADALSWIQGLELLMIAVSSVSTELLDRVKKSWEIDIDYGHLIQQLIQRQGPSRFASVDDLLKRKGRILVELWKDIVSVFHASSIEGYSSTTTTLQRIATLLY